MNLDQTHQVLEPIATRAFDYGDFVLDCAYPCWLDLAQVFS